MSRNLDKSFLLTQGMSLAASGLVASPVAGQPPFNEIAMMGYNHLSVTINCSGTAAGNFNFECSDFGFNAEVFDSSKVFWAPLNQPNTTTQYTVAVSGANNYNIQIPNLGVKFIRLRYVSTSGTGTTNIAVTCRSNSR